MARKGQFKKGGGRVGSATRSRKKGGALVRYKTNTITKWRTRSPARRPRRSRGRGRGGSGGVTAVKLGVTAAALGLALGSQNHTIKPVAEFVDKIPGTKTFGRVAVGGLALGALGHFTNIGGRYRPWLRAAGAVGLVVAAIKLGSDNSDFKFVGDDYDDDDSIMDVED